MSAPSRSHDGRRNGSHQSTPRTPRPADSSSSSDGDSDARRSVRTPSLSRALAPTAGEADATPDVDEVIRRGRQLLRDLAPLSAGRRSAGGRSRADSRNSAITDDGRGDGGNYTLNTTGGDHAGPRHEGTSVPLSPHDRRPRYSVMPLAQSIGTPHARAAQYTLDERRAIVDAINTPGRRSVRGVRTPASVRARRASSEPAWQPGSARIRDDDGDFDDGPSTHGTHRRLLRPQLQQRETPRDTLRALSRLLRRGESEGPDLAGQARRSSDNGEDYARDAKGTSTANIRYSDQDDGLDPTPHRARSDLTDDASPPLVGHRSAGLEDRDDTDLGNESTAMEVARRQTNASLLRPTARRSSLAAALLLRDDNDDSRVGLGPKGGEDRRFSRAPSVVSDVTGLLPEWPSILGPVAADADVSGMKTGLPLVSASVQRVPKLAEHERVSDWRNSTHEALHGNEHVEDEESDLVQGRDGQMEAAGDDTEPLFRPPSKDGKGDGREIASSPAGFEINLDVGEVDAAVDDREQSVGPVDEVQSDGERPIAFDGGDGDDEVLPAGEVSGLGVGENNDGDEEEEDEDDDDDDGDDDDDDGDNDEDDGNDNQFGESNGIAPEARRGTFRRPDRRPWESTPQKWTRPSLSAHGLAYPDMPVSHVRDVAAAAMQQAVGSRTKIKKPSGRMLDLFCRFTHDALRQMADAVGGYARHAGRKTIDDSDVALLFQRQRLTKTADDLFALAQRELPRELLQEIRMPQPVASGKRKRRATNGATHERRGKRRATGDSVRIDDADESAVT